MNVNRYFLPAMLGFALALAGCTAPADDSPTGPSSALALSVEAQPASAPADGASRLVVFVDMRQDGEPVADSTQVILLHSVGTLDRGVVYTSSGIALDTLTADTVAASGWLIACAQGLRDSVRISFTPLP